MHRTALRQRWPRLSAWVLWLALLLPLAQLAGAMHAYVHLSDPARVGSDKHLLAPGDLCVVAAALGSTAPGTAHAVQPPVAVEHAAPQPVAASAPPVHAPSPYRSRAPPALQA